MKARVQAGGVYLGLTFYQQLWASFDIQCSVTLKQGVQPPLLLLRGLGPKNTLNLMNIHYVTFHIIS